MPLEYHVLSINTAILTVTDMSSDSDDDQDLCSLGRIDFKYKNLI